MPKVWLPHCAALVYSVFFPWFPIFPPVVPEAEQVALAAPISEEPVVLPGVVIEEIAKASALEKAGLQVGDVILAWERLPNPPANPEGAKGELRSYFGWLELEVEQVPRGAVVLRGRRGGEFLEFKVELGHWEAKVRPALSRALEEIYLAGKAHFASGNVEAAVQVWRLLSDGVGGQAEGDFRAWVALQIGRAWRENGDWGRALQAYGEAVQAAESPLARIRAQQSRGLAHWGLREFQLSDEAYTSALHLCQGLWPESLSVAFSLTVVGQVALVRGDLDRAHGYFVGALQIQEREAPNSLHLATSLTLLGQLAADQDELDLAQAYHSRALQIRELLNPQSFDAALNLNDLGMVAGKRGDLNLSYDYYRQALTIFERLAPGSLSVAVSLSNLGTVFLEKGELDRAPGLHCPRVAYPRETLLRWRGRGYQLEQSWHVGIHAW